MCVAARGPKRLVVQMRLIATMKLQSVLVVAVVAVGCATAAHELSTSQSSRAGSRSADSSSSRLILLVQRVGAEAPLDRWLDLAAAISAATTALGRVG